MAQVTKFTIDPNLSGIQLRTQASEMLTALSTLNSGNLEPVNPTGGMLWLDTTKNILKIRDKTNTAWLDFASVNDKVIAASAADSAKLGGVAADKYLKTGSFGLGVKTAIKITNLDDTTLPIGFYRTVYNETTGTFPPIWGSKAGYGVVLIERLDEGYITQTLKIVDSSGIHCSLWYRCNRDASTWNSWVEIVTNAGIGIGQTWQDVTSERHTGVTYTNTTGKPIFISVYMHSNVPGGSSAVEIFVDDKLIGGQYAGVISGITVFFSACAIVPFGSTYSAKTSRTQDFSYQDASRWLELR